MLNLEVDKLLLASFTPTPLPLANDEKALGWIPSSRVKTQGRKMDITHQRYVRFTAIPHSKNHVHPYRSVVGNSIPLATSHIPRTMCEIFCVHLSKGYTHLALTPSHDHHPSHHQRASRKSLGTVDHPRTHHEMEQRFSRLTHAACRKRSAHRRKIPLSHGSKRRQRRL